MFLRVGDLLTPVVYPSDPEICAEGIIHVMILNDT